MAMERDRLSGAAEIGSDHAGRLLAAVDNGTLYESCRTVLASYPSMASLWVMANLACVHGADAAGQYEKMGQARDRVVMHGMELLEHDMRVLTYSRSSTVMRILRESTDKHIGVICGEGRPSYEGRRLARELSEADIEVRFATDAGVLSCTSEADMVLIGADALLQGRVVNKRGSMALALAAERHGVPLYVAASSYKRFPFVLVREEPPGEVWSDAPPGVTVENVYFEAVPDDLVTGFVTEHGVRDAIPSFDGPVADEIWRLRDELAVRYRLLEE